jgi:hypothetical protein
MSTLHLHLPSDKELQYYQYLDKNARHKRMAIQLENRTFYGQLLSILVIKVQKSLEVTETVLLATIQSIVVEDSPPSCNITYYKDMGPKYVVDLNAVECVVGRIKDRGRWAIVDRAPPSDV